GNGLFHQSEHLLIISGCEAHRPIRAEHDAFRTEGLQNMIDIKTKIRWLPYPPISLSNQSRQFAINIWITCNVLHLRRPRLPTASLDIRLCEVINHKRLTGKMGQKLQGRIQLVGFDQQIVGKPMLPQRVDPPQKRRPKQKTRIFLPLYNVPESFQLRKTLEVSQPLFHFIGLQIHPAHNSLNKRVFVGELQQEQRFGLGLISLHSYTTGYRVSLIYRPQIIRKEIPLDYSHIIGNPRIPHWIIPPEMLMCINALHASNGSIRGKPLLIAVTYPAHQLPARPHRPASGT